MQKNIFISVFFRKKTLTVYVVTNWSNRLKNTEQLKFCLCSIFYAFLKVLHEIPPLDPHMKCHVQILQLTNGTQRKRQRTLKATLHQEEK